MGKGVGIERHGMRYASTTLLAKDRKNSIYRRRVGLLLKVDSMMVRSYFLKMLILSSSIEKAIFSEIY